MPRLLPLLAVLFAAGLLTAPSAAAQTETTVAGTFTVTAGSATASNTAPNESTIVVGDSRTILDFQSFDLQQGATLNLEFAGRADTALLRVSSLPGASGLATVNGNLNARIGTGGAFGGNVWLSARNGVAFGSGSDVNVGGLHATTANLASDASFAGDATELNFAGAVGATEMQSNADIVGHGGPLALLGSGVTQDATATVGNVASDDTEVAYGAAGGYRMKLGTTMMGDLELLELLPFEASTAQPTNAMQLNGTTTAGDVFVVSFASGPVNVSGTLTARRAVASGGGDVVLAAGGGMTRTDAVADPRATRSAGAASQRLNLRSTVTAEDVLIARSTGQLTISGTPAGRAVGGDIALATDGVFVNERGSTAIAHSPNDLTPTWVIYAATPFGTAPGNLNSATTALWNRDFDDVPPGHQSLGPKRYVFQLQPTLDVTSTNVTKAWDQDASGAVDAAYTITEYANGLNQAFLADNASTAHSGTPSMSSIAEYPNTQLVNEDPLATDDGPYVVDASTGTLSSAAGYAFEFIDAGRLDVTPAEGDNPPLITSEREGELGENGWYVTDVDQSYATSDVDGDDVDRSSSCDGAVIAQDTAGTDFACTVTAKGRRRSRSDTIKRDATPPVITATASSDGDPYTEGAIASDDVTVTFTCTDAMSGVASDTVGDATVTKDGATTVTSAGTCADNAGHDAEPVTFGPIRIDRPDPPKGDGAGTPSIGPGPVGSPSPPAVGNQSKPGPSATTIRRLLGAQMGAAVSGVRGMGLQRFASRGYQRSFTADQPGVLTEDVLIPAPRRGRARTAATKMLVAARGTARFAAAGTKTVRVKPTRAGKRAMRGKRTLKVVIRTTFKPAGAAKAIVVTSRSITIRRR